MASKKQHNEEECSCDHEHDECSCGHEHNMPNDKQAQKEMLELNVLDMQLRQLEQQAIMVEQQIAEQQLIISSLEEFKKAKPGKSMLFPFSKDIFVEGKLESTNVLVNVGSKTLVKKSIDEAKKIAEKQKQRLLQASSEIRGHMERFLARINELEQKLNQ